MVLLYLYVMLNDYRKKGTKHAYITGFVSCKGIPATVFVSVLSAAIDVVVGLLIVMRISKNTYGFQREGQI